MRIPLHLKLQLPLGHSELFLSTVQWEGKNNSGPHEKVGLQLYKGGRGRVIVFETYMIYDAFIPNSGKWATVETMPKQGQYTKGFSVIPLD